MLEQRHRHERLPVSHWAREHATNQISALDAVGGVVMTLTNLDASRVERAPLPQPLTPGWERRQH